MTRLLVVLVLAVAMAAGAAQADDLRPGYLEWTEHAAGQWRVTWKAPLLGGLATRARPLMPKGCRTVSSLRRFEGPTVVTNLAVACDAPLTGREVGLAGLHTGFTDALLRVAPLNGVVQATRLTPAQPAARAAQPTADGGAFATYLKLGIEHILFAFDHLLFVVALVLLLGGWRRIVAAVTAFTVAHSLTLAAAALGFVGTARKPVEVCIALSIVLVAREILRRPEEPLTLARRAPALIAFVFGLLHGFGFAAALVEIGLPEGEIPIALLAFNLGVELGQLAIVAATLAGLTLLARASATMQRRAVAATGYAIGIIASAWLIERVLA